jgi:3-oxoacyl-(acyl-carrier-protein) synthase
MTFSIACASGTAAIGIAADLVRDGAAEAMLAGGYDCLALSPLAGLSALHTLTTEDIRPFCRTRSGTLFGEGAGMVLVEELEHARARQAEPLAEVLGSWQNNNAFHLIAPDEGGAGMARCLRRALEEAGLPPAEVDYINAHGTGTEHHDPAETQAIKTVLGAHAYEIGVSSIKGAIGHLMGAAGAVETIATVLALRDGIMPPTVNLAERDEACDLDYVPNEARRADLRHAVSISAGIGGSNAVIVLGKI